MRNELSMIDIENPGGIAGLGRGEDTMLAHVAPGEMVVPPVLSPETQETIKQEMIAVGLDPNQYTVGDGMSINPITGMAEFGFLKKLGKALKKVVKKVAPIALPLLIPGVGGALSTGLSRIGSALNIPKGIGILDKVTPIREGIGGLLGMGGGQQDVMYQDQFGNVVSADEYANMNEADKILYNQINNQQVGPLGTPVGPFLRNTFLGTKEDPGLLRNIVSGDKDSTFMGVNPGLAALAALYGKAVKEDFKKKEGGLKDIRQSIRPDLMPAPTFTGFDLGIRPGMSYGGRIDEQELDLRMGGPSIGPGTGTSDDIPAMLSDGEFVMTSSANNGLGGFKITKTETGIELIPNGAPDRQKGAKNMDKLMKTFEKFNEIGKV